MTYDDLMTNNGWSAPNDQQQFHFQQQPASAYGQFNPQTYSQFDLSQQPQYPAVTYSNSPYTSQYQNARPSDVFGPTTSFTEASLHDSSGYHGHDSSFSFAPSSMDSAPTTIAPQNLQYSSMPPSQTMDRTMSSSSTLQRQQNGLVNNFSQRSQDTIPTYYQTAQTGNFQPPQSNNIRYPTLPNEIAAQPRQITKVDEPPYQNVSVATPRPQQTRSVPPPNPLRVVYPASDEENKSRLPHAPFLAWDDEPIHVPNGLKSM